MDSRNASLVWKNLQCDLAPWINDAIVSLGFPTMTPVQASTIPLFSGNKDVVVEAVTGSGKTLAFALPVLHKVSQRLYCDDEPVKKGHMLAVVLSPTRELAAQIQKVFQLVLDYLPAEKSPIRTQLLVGLLSSVREDVDEFLSRKPHILVATPGRFLDFLGSQYVKTASVEIVVLDEADKLLDISFETDVVAILKRMPKQRRTGLFSATMSSAGDLIFRTGMANPVKVAVRATGASAAAPSSLNIAYMPIPPEHKFQALVRLLSDYRFKKCIVYVPTCTSVKHFYALFDLVVKTADIKYFSLHGKLLQKARLRAIEGFASGDTTLQKYVLLTTDVAARGIDIPDVDLVIQLDPPTDPDMFLHRCGRTGRANKVGQAIVMLNEGSREEDYVDFMAVKGVKMREMEPPKGLSDKSFSQKIAQFMLDDRARHELAIRSYVGFIKYYTKHVASSIFRMQTLDYIGIARMYGLLRLPKMPEARYISNDIMPEDGWLGEPIDMDKYAYADTEKEKARLATLEEDKAKKITDAKARKALKQKNQAWSSKTEAKDSKLERKEKLKRKREAIEKQIAEESSDDETPEDWKEIAKRNKKQRTTETQGLFDDL